MNVAQKIAVITGASSGLGAALAKAFIAKGAQVYGLARSTEKLKALQKDLGNNFIPVSLDVSVQEKVAEWAQTTFSKNHSPNILVNSAGVGYLKQLSDLSLAEWHNMVNTNLNGTFYLTAAIMPFLKQSQSSGHIINIGSILGKNTIPISAAYSATKFAIQGFSAALFKELRGHNIKVTCVNPGSIETSFFEDSGISPQNNMLKPEDVAALLVQIVETPDNLLIDEITLRPLNPTTSKN